ncbi:MULTISPECIES: GerW family sporulation protein [Clostridium]|uniref:GerW family sporulation protein n=1 Tax=Clostridium cibarium TaxID=2762247 RepID=A0ABR8PPA3_9CLOT|nr:MULTISPECIES: GerW family sporulation protein [Clostridium]MBD7909991.1 GerW family sporulation protein [Clostridium cibarium]
MNNEHPIDNLMKSTMENLRDMIDVNTVIGDAVETKDGSYIIPISKVSFGFASGGSEFPDKSNSDKLESKYPFGGGSGAGVTVKPVAFLVVKEDSVRLLPLDHDSTYDRIVDTVPQVMDMIKDLFKKPSSNKSQKSDSYDSTDYSCKLNDE